MHLPLSYYWCRLQISIVGKHFQNEDIIKNLQQKWSTYFTQCSYYENICQQSPPTDFLFSVLAGYSIRVEIFCLIILTSFPKSIFTLFPLVGGNIIYGKRQPKRQYLNVPIEIGGKLHKKEEHEEDKGKKNNICFIYLK